MSPNRNDPCPCGSGKKYKHCCMRKEQLSQLEQILWERAYRSLRTNLVEFAQEPEQVAPVAEGLKLFWDRWFIPQALESMNEDEALIFFDWLLFDYRFGEEPTRLIDAFAATEPEYLDEKEWELLDLWIALRPGVAWRLDQIDEGGDLHLTDLFADRLPEGEDARVVVNAPAAAQVVEPGEILLGRPVPVAEGYRLSGTAVRLPASTEETLKALIAEGEAAYREEHPESTWFDFLRDRSYLFFHFAMKNAEDEGRPATSFSEGEAQPAVESRHERPVLPGRKQRRIGRG